MIPENKEAAVKKALLTAFGVDSFESADQITKGLSSAVILKIIVHERPYLLRVITRTDPMGDPAYYFARMQVAAEAELGPKIYYLNAHDRISITAFVNEQPFPMEGAADKMAALLQKLHALPRFPFRVNYFDAMDGFISKYTAAHIVPEQITKELFEAYHQVISVYPRNDVEGWVSCHNDLKRENIIFDGQRPWLVDWEGAFLNDRYLDLAVVANFVARNENDRENFLQRYFGQFADEYQHARLLAMSQILHVHYFIIFMLVGTLGQPISFDSIEKNDFRNFHGRMWNGEIDLADNLTKLQYARVHMQQALQNYQSGKLDSVLHLLSMHHKSH